MSALSSVPNETDHKIKITEHETSLLGHHRRYTHYLSTPPHTPVAHQYPSVRYALQLTPEDRFRRARPLPGITKLEFRKTPICPQPRKSLKPELATLVDEDCLFCEIWIPADMDDQEQAQRPVFIFIHGGFLQFGSVYMANAAELVRRTGAVVVMPVYRLHVLGFLSCEEMREDTGVAGNLGFWDQRMAIDWVARNIHAFGGDAGMITVGGYSAGAYSSFHQVMYESYLPDDRAHIKNLIMWSNGCGLQPKSLAETRSHFDQYAEALGLPREMKGSEKFAKMRRLPVAKLVEAVDKIPANSFRAATDGDFVQRTYLQDIVSGRLGQLLNRRKIKLMIGEVKDERKVYERVQPPSSYIGLIHRLAVEYPAINSNRLATIYATGGQLPDSRETWKDLFGQIYADCQIHLTERGLLHALKGHMSAENILRYRIYRRLKCVDDVMAPDMGVTHSTDMYIWFAGNGKSIQPEEKKTIDIWLMPMRDFLAGKKTEWPTSSDLLVLRTIPEDAWKVATESDPLWWHYMDIWRRLFASRRVKL